MRIRCVNSPYQMTTPFGNVPGYPLNNGFHTGVDYVSNDGLIVSPMESKVVQIGYDDKNGNFLVLEHNGYRDWFSHIKEYRVIQGQAVPMGFHLAVMGATGAATGVHVHHSLRVNGELVDPEKYIEENEMLTKAEVNQLIQIAHNRPARDDEKSVYSSIPTTEALQRILDGQENIQLRTDAMAYRQGQSGTILKPGTYQVK